MLNYYISQSPILDDTQETSRFLVPKNICQLDTLRNLHWHVIINGIQPFRTCQGNGCNPDVNGKSEIQ